jgi:hypothetical protein
MLVGVKVSSILSSDILCYHSSHNEEEWKFPLSDGCRIAFLESTVLYSL